MQQSFILNSLSNANDKVILFNKNLKYLPDSVTKVISNLPNSPFEIVNSKNGELNLKLGNIFLHSKHDPSLEAQRLSKELPYDNSDRIYLFIGAGLGYTILASLNNRDRAQAVWIESNPFIVKHALETIDFSFFLEMGRLQILISPIDEDLLYNTFRGRSTVPVTIVNHRGSMLIKEEDYSKIRLLAEGFFHKKDVNLATLIRFEKLWTKNILKNLIATIGMQPVSRLFGISNCPILVVGAGPSLVRSIPDIKKYIDHYLIIAVDTCVPILTAHGIDPDIIYTVDPQALNRVYLESYTGNAAIILDPTSTYFTPRISDASRRGFFTLSPFPLTRILETIAEEEIGGVPFGGSVSTNAYGLADLMGGDPIYFVGQDLAFTFGHAHAKGAIMEEMLNYQESRRFRRELHNYKQLYYLPRHRVEAFSESVYNNFYLITNEKMIIFRNWFSLNACKAINLTHTGLKILNIKNSSFSREFIPSNSKLYIENTNLTRYKLRSMVSNFKPWTDYSKLCDILMSLRNELEAYLTIVELGYNSSKEIYDSIASKKEDPSVMQEKIRMMNDIDENVSTHKHLGDILSSSMQRAIYSVTEGFESTLSPDEKLNPNLAIAKKSTVLYESLMNQTKELIHHIKKIALELN